MIKALAVLILAAAAAGAFFWYHQTPQAAPMPLAQVRGSSFDVPVKPPVVPPEPPPPAVVPPPVVAEVQPEPKPEPKPIVVAPPEVKPEPKPEVKPAPAPAPEAKPADEKPMTLTFARLAFRYWPQTKDKGARDPFPKEIKALNGKKIVMDGFMFPIDFE